MADLTARLQRTLTIGADSFTANGASCPFAARFGNIRVDEGSESNWILHAITLEELKQGLIGHRFRP